ncbi:MAG: bis(5'-nucleosyl)-tetraphosphatase (symmetrical) YqeK [Clostridia bacterium]|nr:bis(5'-nucleosyl)-tetraphosphatase (symmetrical) YqeK [Clostridia bacterium]
MEIELTTERLNELRTQIGKLMSGFRLAHTLGVESMAARLGALYCPDRVPTLRAAALLHDITKELSVDEQTAIYREHGAEPAPEELAAPATLHAVTAAWVIMQRYPDFASQEIIDAVRYHTTGRAGMSLCEKLIYLADYIDETRTYADCVALRNEFFAAEPQKMSAEERLAHLNRVILHSFDLTVSDLIEKRRVISAETVAARNSIIFELEIKN